MQPEWPQATPRGACPGKEKVHAGQAKFLCRQWESLYFGIIKRMQEIGHATSSRFKRYSTIVPIFLLAILLLPAIIIFACYAVIDPYERFILSGRDTKHTEVGIVLGAGITRDGKPYNELRARLDTAAAAINNGIVERLILSGDNRFNDYNEPEAMMKYLVGSKGIPADKLQPDYAGRSTYESCERAAKAFNIKEAIIISAGSHLPRAIYLCRHFNVQAYGISSGVEANNSTRRELLARVKAVYNTNVMGERTMLER